MFVFDYAGISIDSRGRQLKGWTNKLIWGDNKLILSSLKNGALREEIEKQGGIKLIYIDPPYNTGNDFVYSDKFNQDKKEYWEDAEVTENGYKIDTNVETDGRFHSNWLNMMYPRLKLARNLLKDDGVIFISIDDGEVCNLKLMCDEIFGNENFLANLMARSVLPVAVGPEIIRIFLNIKPKLNNVIGAHEICFTFMAK